MSQTDVGNLVLMQLGMRKIQSITNQTDPSAIALLTAWPQAFSSVARETPWNCLKQFAILPQLQVPTTATCYNNDIPSSATTWAPATSYAVNAYVIYAGYLYQCLINNVSSSAFGLDLTMGYWFQTNTFSPSFFGLPAGNASPGTGWTYAYELPTDFIALVELNGNACWGGWGWGAGTGARGGQSCEIFQRALYCNSPSASIRYMQYVTDTTLFDSLFTDALVFKLATMVATTLRKDDATLSGRMMQEYQRVLTEARVKNAGEDKLRRYNICSESRFVRSRRWSTNG